jgi:hypothetical protein
VSTSSYSQTTCADILHTVGAVKHQELKTRNNKKINLLILLFLKNIFY